MVRLKRHRSEVRSVPKGATVAAAGLPLPHRGIPAARKPAGRTLGLPTTVMDREPATRYLRNLREEY